MQSNSTAPKFTGKPEKPRPDFPLFPHATKRWAKKIRGKMHYFGPWDDPHGAEQKYLDQKEYLHAGRKPRLDAEGVTIKDLVNAFLNHKQGLVDSGELTLRSWKEYKETADMLVAELGKRRIVVDVGPDDFAILRKKMAARWGLHRLAKNIQYTRSVFKFAIESGMIDKPILFGQGFARPSKRSFRVEKAKQEVKLFSRDELRTMLDAAPQPLKAMLLLGINCGFGNADCGQLRMSAINLETGWVVFPRPKTGMDRRCPLWPETIAALRGWLDDLRPTPASDDFADLVFVTAKGGSWCKESSDNPVSKETAKLLKKLEINSSRNFYTVRHTHRTIGDEKCDQRASDFIMGHVDPTISAHYVERIGDERLRAVTDHIRTWLFGAKRKRNVK